MAKQKKNRGTTNEQKFWGRELEYIMPRAMYDAITAECKGDKMQCAIDAINDTFGVLGHVTSLVLEDVEVNMTSVAILE